jgi:hypothetical protein
LIGYDSSNTEAEVGAARDDEYIEYEDSDDDELDGPTFEIEFQP